MSSVRQIAIIGAGAAGLCAARHLSQFKNLKPVVLEATAQVGGTWVYTDQTDKDENGFPIQSSMYKGLITNLPKQTMAFPDFPFPASLPSFVHHNDMLEYLKSYANHFDLNQYIELNTLVDEVSVIPGNENLRFPKWNVKTFDWKTKEYDNRSFDGVMVCNGHYSVPNMPVIEGMDDFKGRILHSHHFRTNEQFVDKNVVLFGGKSSGTDIAILLSKVAKNIMLSHKGKRLIAPLPSNLHDELPIRQITEDGVVFDDGKMVKCDIIMFCTGYNYYFPFFKDDSIIQNVKNRVTPLYKHVVHINYPNLSFIGLCVFICPFPQFHCQTLLACGMLDGSVPLLSVSDMLRDQDEDYRKRVEDGLPIRGSHVMGDKQWAYNDELADISGKQRIPANVRLLYDLAHHRRTLNLQHYKEENYALSLEGNYYKIDSDLTNGV